MSGDVPCDLDAEKGLLGSVLREPAQMERLYGVVEPDWFWSPNHRRLWETLESLWVDGRGLRFDARYETWDLYLVRDEAGVEPFDVFVSDLADAALTSVTGITALLARLAYRRRMLSVGDELRYASERDEDLDQLATEADRIAGRLDVGERRAVGLWGHEVLVEDDTDDPWVVPGLLRRGWRVVLVAGEGVGKSTLERQVAVCTAAGLHPFTLRPVEAQMVLLVDLENSPSLIRRSLRSMFGAAGDAGTDRLRLLRQPAGLDLRRPRQRAVLEAEMRLVRPDLLVLGPLYKAYSRAERENEEQAAMAAQHVFDVLRDRYGCAVLLEHHAPHRDGATREMRPFGSSAWLRWPELGFGLVPSSDDRAPAGSLELTRWRGDRDSHVWPARFDRSKPWPWTGYYPDGMPADPS